MRKLDLDGAWELAWFDEAGAVPGTPAALADLGGERIAARVPGNVELDLVRAGRLPEPFEGKNILELRRWEGCQWWYLREFPTPEWIGESGTDLVFEGLDCFATVWINGVEAGRAANALIGHRFDVSSLLAPPGGTNRIAVRLASPVNAVRDLPFDADMEAWPSRFESLWARKPAHGYGWDIMPRALLGGLWRPVRLEERRATELTDAFLDTRSATDEEAVLECRIAFRTGAALADFAVKVSGRCGDSVFEKELPLFFTRAAFEVPVPRPRLWWPRGYGEAALYDVTVTLLHRGAAVSERRLRLGIRTVELDRTDLHTPEQPGRFSFVVNGVPVFCRGSNWVPADAFHSRDAERIPRILELFADMECNMIRCWGGGVYETHAFFDACDREGFLVWQDFALACASYPQAPAFREMLRAEAGWIVRELRQHPSLALWSGDNEVDELNVAWGRRRYDPSRNRLTREVLPEATRLLDPRRPYLPSSPYIPAEALAHPEPNRVVPEQHLWGPRDYFKSPFYLTHGNHALFASELGYHGCPAPASLRRFLSPGKLWPCLDNDEWTLHGTDSVPEYPMFAYRVKLMVDQVRNVFGEIPDGLGHFAAASQIVQAEAKKFFLELFRQRKGTATGILWWNMIDGWPQMSDAVVDYYFAKKLAYWYLRRAHRPFAVVVHEPGADGRLEVSTVNDSRRPRAGTVRVWDADTGETALEGPFAVGPNARSRCGFVAVPQAPGEQRLFLVSWTEGSEAGCGHYLHGRPPFDYRRYREEWLPKIAALDGSFRAGGLAADA